MKRYLMLKTAKFLYWLNSLNKRRIAERINAGRAIGHEWGEIMRAYRNERRLNVVLKAWSR